MKVTLGKYPKNPLKDRKIKIKIDPYDCWNLDSSLASIIVPALKLFKETTSGIPGSYYERVCNSNHGQLSFDFMYETAEEIEAIVSKQWKEVIDKMIWSFEQIQLDDYAYTVDKQVQQLYRERIQEGLDLFAKYYNSLWD